MVDCQLLICTVNFLQTIDFPGGKVSFVAEMNFLPESHGERISCYRVLDDDGRTISGSRFREVHCSLHHFQKFLETYREKDFCSDF